MWKGKTSRNVLKGFYSCKHNISMAGVRRHLRAACEGLHMEVLCEQTVSRAFEVAGCKDFDAKTLRRRNVGATSDI